MRRRKPLLTGIACAAVLLATLITIRRPPSRESEPTYAGHSLSEWMATNAIAVVTSDIARSEQAENAIREIGTNAIPYLLRWIAEEPPIPPTAAAKLPAPVTENPVAQLVIDGPNNQRAFDATYAFSILGTNATSAIPRLNLLIADTKRPVTAHRALTALAYIGAPAFPTTLAALADTNHPYRGDIASTMETLMANELDVATNMQPFVAALTDSDVNVRIAATNIVSQHFPRALTNFNSR